VSNSNGGDDSWAASISPDGKEIAAGIMLIVFLPAGRKWWWRLDENPDLRF
jgi:hypothetical protein